MKQAVEHREPVRAVSLCPEAGLLPGRKTRHGVAARRPVFCPVWDSHAVASPRGGREGGKS